MANYALANSNAGTQQNLSGTYKTILIVTGTTATLRRNKVYDVLVGTNGAPADNYIEWDISRQTAPGTATALTPTLLDPADGAAVATCAANATAESGSVTANSSVFYIGINQRASYRWVAAPGSELVGPATNAAGLILRARSGGYTSTVTATMLYQEQ